MKYFDDLRFTTANRIPEYRSEIRGYRPKVFSLEWCRRGKMVFSRDGGKRVILDAPFAFWLEPGHSYDYGAPAGTTREHAYICFAGPRGERLVKRGLATISPTAWARPADPVAFRNLFYETVDLVAKAGPGVNPEAAVALERLLLCLASDDRSSRRASATTNALKALAETIAAGPFKPFDFKTLAKTKYHMTYRHFTRLFCRTVREAPHRYVLTCRIRKIATELLETDKTIKEIAFAAGYDDPSRFSRDFKARTGCSPSDFRERRVQGRFATD